MRRYGNDFWTYSRKDMAGKVPCMVKCFDRYPVLSSLSAIEYLSIRCMPRISCRKLPSCLRLCRVRQWTSAIYGSEGLTVAEHSSGFTFGAGRERDQCKCASECDTDPWQAIFADLAEDSWSLSSRGQTIQGSRGHKEISAAS